MLSIAVPTGRMLKECIPLLMQMGLPYRKLESPGRLLVIPEKSCRYLLAKPMDVPAYVHYGAADMAFAGSDVLMERSVPLAELADTGVGRCRLVIAGPENMASRFAGVGSHLSGLRVATKYPEVTKSFFKSRGIALDIIHLHGSVELAPLLGISDCILDIVQSGETLRANGLKVIQEVAHVSVRIVANRKFTQTNWEMLSKMIDSLQPWKGRRYHGAEI
ncbi:MAG: ATP phosphoribosyltransferase [Thermovirga sp.]